MSRANGLEIEARDSRKEDGQLDVNVGPIIYFEIFVALYWLNLKPVTTF